MTREEIFEAWAPPYGLWSPWAKPVLFAHCGGEITQPLDLARTDISWAPPADGQTAIVLDIPVGSPGTELEFAL